MGARLRLRGGTVGMKAGGGNEGFCCSCVLQKVYFTSRANSIVLSLCSFCRFESRV